MLMIFLVVTDVMGSSTATTPTDQNARTGLPTEILLINELHGLFEFLMGRWVEGRGARGGAVELFSKIFKQSSFFIILF